MSENIWKELLKDAYEAATKSLDPSTQNGAILIGWDGKKVVSECNRFPDKVENTQDRWQNRPLKYKIVVHAEAGAVLTAAKNGINTNGLVMVSPWSACSECAKCIIQAGIVKLVRHKQASDRSPKFWLEEIEIADMMLKEASVEIVDYDGEVDGPEVRHSGVVWRP